MKKSILIVIIFLVTFNAFGKCGSIVRSIEGQIYSNDEPILGAMILFSFINWKDEKVILETVTESDGQYLIEYEFYPFSGFGFWGGHKCDLEPRKARIEVKANGYMQVNEVIKIQGIRTTYNKSMQPTI